MSDLKTKKRLIKRAQELKKKYVISKEDFYRIAKKEGTNYDKQ